ESPPPAAGIPQSSAESASVSAQTPYVVPLRPDSIVRQRLFLRHPSALASADPPPCEFATDCCLPQTRRARCGRGRFAAKSRWPTLFFRIYVQGKDVPPRMLA